jgi:hypothetical protein
MVVGTVDIYDTPGVKISQLAAGFIKSADGNAWGSNSDDILGIVGSDLLGGRAISGVGCWRSLSGKYFHSAKDNLRYPGGAALDITMTINGFA